MEKLAMLKSYKSGITVAVLALVCSPLLAEQLNPMNPNRTETIPRERAPGDSESRDTIVDTPRLERGDQLQISEFYAGKLILMNKGTIEMSKWADERASSEEVKQFARMLVEHHTALNDQLAKVAPNVADMLMQQPATDEGANERDAYPEDKRETSSTTNARPDPRNADRPATLGTSTERGDWKDKTNGFSPLHQVLAIEKQAGQNFGKSSTDMLSKYEGQEFDMGFLGFQIGSHTWALAELKAIEKVGDPEFQKIVAQATVTVEQHLKQAQQLSMKFENDLRAAKTPTTVK